MPPSTPFSAIVLAAQRRGTIDPLAQAAGLSHKCLVPIGGRPLIWHVVAALASTPGLDRLRIVVEPEMFESVLDACADIPVKPEFRPAADNLADSVIETTHDLDQPTIVTTADNVLLSSDAVQRMRAALAADADVAIAMATRAAVLAAHPDGQRRFYRFSDDEYSNCNLYGFAGAHAFRAAETFRSGGQFAKRRRRLIAAVGVVNVVLMLMRTLSLAAAMRRLSRRLGVRIVPVVVADGALAIDVDNDRTYRVAALLLASRQDHSGAEKARQLDELAG